jgi:hypothetical protein
VTAKESFEFQLSFRRQFDNPSISPKQWPAPEVPDAIARAITENGGDPDNKK